RRPSFNGVLMIFTLYRACAVLSALLTGTMALHGCADDPCHNGWMGGDYVMGPCGCYTAGDGNGCEHDDTYGRDNHPSRPPENGNTNVSAAGASRDVSEGGDAGDASTDVDVRSDAGDAADSSG